MIDIQTFERYQARRKLLRERVTQEHGPGVIMLVAAVEPSHSTFRQDKNFYYYTGLQEPGAVLLIMPDGTTRLFVPDYAGVRNVWVGPEVVAGDVRAAAWGIDDVAYMGDPERGYSIVPFRALEQYKNFVAELKRHIGGDLDLQVIGLPNCYAPVYAQQLAFHVRREVLLSDERISLINGVVAAQRRCKDAYEVSCIEQAISITRGAQFAAKAALQDGAREYEVRAALESEMTREGSKHLAFPSIVASGKSATVLHYTDLDQQCKSGDLVVVDIGAEYKEYASDITRTWSVGEVSKRQRDLALIVKKIQTEVAQRARPGLFLRKKDEGAISLNGIARELLASHGYGHAMPHSIGHFMGLDVHDVGDVSIPLAPGDVITIEPGIYLPEEGVGIRIEDNYLITEQGARCLSADIEGEW